MLVNLTPHMVRVFSPSGKLLLTIPPSGTVARLKNRDGQELILPGGVRLIKTHFGDPEGLPDPEPGVFFIVSSMTRLSPQCVTRDDLISPRDLVRDTKGNVIGCKSFDWN